MGTSRRGDRGRAPGVRGLRPHRRGRGGRPGPRPCSTRMAKSSRPRSTQPGASLSTAARRRAAQPSSTRARLRPPPSGRLSGQENRRSWGRWTRGDRPAGLHHRDRGGGRRPQRLDHDRAGCGTVRSLPAAPAARPRGARRARRHRLLRHLRQAGPGALPAPRGHRRGRPTASTSPNSTCAAAAPATWWGGAVRAAAHAQASRRDARCPAPSSRPARMPLPWSPQIPSSPLTPLSPVPSRTVCGMPTLMWRGADMPRIVSPAPLAAGPSRTTRQGDPAHLGQGPRGPVQPP